MEGQLTTPGLGPPANYLGDSRWVHMGVDRNSAAKLYITIITTTQLIIPQFKNAILQLRTATGIVCQHYDKTTKIDRSQQFEPALILRSHCLVLLKCYLSIQVAITVKFLTYQYIRFRGTQCNTG